MDSPFRIGVRSAVALAVPATVLLTAGLAFVIAYYKVPAVNDALSHVGALKARYGVVYVMAGAALFSAFVPWLMRMAVPSLRPANPGPELLFMVLWWMPMLVINDGLYRFLGYLFDGSGMPFFAVVIAKTLSDMLVYTALFACPANALAHLWKDSGYDTAAMRGALGRGWYARLVLPNLVPNYMVWFPGVALVYAMPADLQIPTANLIGCFWSLMCLQVAARTKGRIVVEPEAAV